MLLLKRQGDALWLVRRQLWLVSLLPSPVTCQHLPEAALHFPATLCSCVAHPSRHQRKFETAIWELRCADSMTNESQPCLARGWLSEKEEDRRIDVPEGNNYDWLHAQHDSGSSGAA